MSFTECISMAFTSLMANKMRALLTMLGIIIGIAAVIAISTVGVGLQNMMNDSMASMGATNVEIYVQSKPDDDGNRNWYEMGDDDYITDDMITKLSEHFSGELSSVSISEGLGSGTVKDGRNKASVRVQGVNDGYRIVKDIKMLKGRFIEDKDIIGAKYTCIASDALCDEIFPNQDPLGQEVKVYLNSNIYTFTVIGEYHHASDDSMTMMMMGSDSRSTDLYVPVSTVKRLSGGKAGYQSVTVQGTPGIDSIALSEKINEFMNKFFAHNPYFQIEVFSMESMAAELATMQDTMILAISVIAGISLLVGGIGVMNIMLVSVTERTREIGTRKALGAPNFAIMAQFIIESAVICLIGGLIGTTLGILLGMLGMSLLNMHGTPTLQSILLAVTFSVAIGVFFGYYPAKKAAHLNPIDALRYE